MVIHKKPVESNMYYCNSRYYVPEWCRWLNADHISCLNPQSIYELNLFAYCGNDPVNYSDESGYMPEWLGNLLTGIGIVEGTELFGASDDIEAFSGGINPVRDYLMGGNQTAYNITSGIFDTLGSIAVLAGMVGQSFYKKLLNVVVFRKYQKVKP